MERLDQLDQQGNANFCELAERWGISTDLAWRLIRSAVELSFLTHRSAFIISGFRSEAEQNELRRRGRPAAPPGRSTHTTCPATGADIWLGPAPPRSLIQAWGNIVNVNGLRFGGGSPLGRDLVPSDWEHVDLGPRGSRPIDWRGPPVYQPPPGPPDYEGQWLGPSSSAPSHNKIQLQQQARQQVRTLKHDIDRTLTDLEWGP